MSTHRGAIDAYHCPDEGAFLVGASLERLERALPEALTAPTNEAIVDGLIGSIAGRQVAPGSASAVDPEDAVDDATVIQVRATALALVLR
jgi:hypothetical protein